MDLPLKYRVRVSGIWVALGGQEFTEGGRKKTWLVHRKADWHVGEQTGRWGSKRGDHVEQRFIKNMIGGLKDQQRSKRVSSRNQTTTKFSIFSLLYIILVRTRRISETWIIYRCHFFSGSIDRYTYTHTCVYIYIYIYTYNETECGGIAYFLGQALDLYP